MRLQDEISWNNTEAAMDAFPCNDEAGDVVIELPSNGCLEIKSFISKDLV